MQKTILLLPFLLLMSSVPAFAEGFSQVEFGLMIFMNLLMGAVLTLFVAVLVSILVKKIKASKQVETEFYKGVERRLVEREIRA